jgi:hypothetical protein
VIAISLALQVKPQSLSISRVNESSNLVAVRVRAHTIYISL